VAVSTAAAQVACSTCGHVFDDYDAASALPRLACPDCDSTGRAFRHDLNDSVEIHEQLAFKARHGGQKPFLEGKSGDSKSHDARWATVEQVVDRENNRYRKKVTDSRGNVIRDVDESLDSHRGYGSAKPKRPATPISNSQIN